MTDATQTVPDEYRELPDALPFGGRAASNLAEEYERMDYLLVDYRAAADLTDIPYVGKERMKQLHEFINDIDPDARHIRKENDMGICVSFTDDPDLDLELAEEDADFGFVCPRCGEENALKGEPSAFKNKPFRCESCAWVSLLDGPALDEFEKQQFSGVATDE